MAPVQVILEPSPYHGTLADRDGVGALRRLDFDRDHAEEATEADIPVFLVHGVNDNAARVDAVQWFTDRAGRAGDRLWLGQWDHGSGCCPTRRGEQGTAALHAWFDRHLAGRQVKTGPPVELFMSDGTFAEARAGDREEVLTAKGWGVERVDLFLQRQREDGTWSGDLASGDSADLTGETMTIGRLAPGRYRVEVHNWAGLPGTSVQLRITFYNSADEAGT